MMNEKFDEAVVDLEHANKDYLEWMVVNGYAQSTRQHHKQMLHRFLSFVKAESYSWDEIFTPHTLSCFKRFNGLSEVSAVFGLSRYLYGQGKISEPIPARKPPPPLPDLYEEYLLYQQQYRQTPDQPIKHIRRVLCAFEHYLRRHRIKLRALRIEHIDGFHSENL